MCVGVYVYAYTHICIYVYIYIYIHTHTHAHTRTHTCIYTHTLTHTHTHAHIYIYIYIYIYTRVHVVWPLERIAKGDLVVIVTIAVIVVRDTSLCFVAGAEPLQLRSVAGARLLEDDAID